MIWLNNFTKLKSLIWVCLLSLVIEFKYLGVNSNIFVKYLSKMGDIIDVGYCYNC